jgi:YgiT-type zinc finger domain-containing protein
MAVRCPICGKGTLRSGLVHERMFGIDLGDYPGEICDRCGESFLSSDHMKRVEERAKELGLWGLASKVRIAKSGNSLVVRIPSRLARYLKLKSGQEVLVAPEEAHRLVLELA